MIETRGTPFELPLQHLRRAQATMARADPHRALARAPCSVTRVAAALGMALALWAPLFAAQPAVMRLWTACLAFWLAVLGFQVAPSAAQDVGQLLAPVTVASPTPLALFAALCLTGVAWFACGRLNGRHLPLKYLLRCLCALLLLSILALLSLPRAFAYTLADHAADLLANGYRCLLVFPFMLAAGYYLFHERLLVKLFYSLVIELYFLVMVPHKVLLHVLVLHAGSRLAMPLLYVCLGSAFDVLAFVALYAWALSNLPPQRHVL